MTTMTLEQVRDELRSCGSGGEFEATDSFLDRMADAIDAHLTSSEAKAGNVPDETVAVIDSMCKIVARESGEDFERLDVFTQELLRGTQRQALRAAREVAVRQEAAQPTPEYETGFRDGFMSAGGDFPEGYVLAPFEPTPEIMAAAAIAAWPVASAADVAMAKEAAMIVLRTMTTAMPGITIDQVAASIATMAPAYRAMIAATQDRGA